MKIIKILFIVFSFAFQDGAKNYVPDGETAIKIAEAIWMPIYGEGILDKRPFVVVSQPDSSVWHISGTLPSSGISVNALGDTTITMIVGGVPNVIINKLDGKILAVYHTK